MGLILRNWHLKLSALLLATVLYTGLVFSGSFTDSSVQVRVEQVNVARDVFVLSAEPGVVEVQYRVANEQAGGVTAEDFVVAVDIGAYDLGRAPEPQELPLEVRALKDGLEDLSTVPETVRVVVDRVEVRSIPVEVELGTIPAGLEIDEPVLSDETVEVRGPAAVVSQVDRAVAFVDIPASGINVNEPVPLILVDIGDQPVGTGQLEVDPEVVSVQIEVRAVETETTVAVRPNIEPGSTPAPGFALEAVRVEPAYVTIAGLPEVLEEITSVTTDPITIDGLAADETFEVELQLPEDVSLADNEPTTVTVTATIGPSVSSRTFVVGVLCTGSGDNACVPRLDEVAITLSGAGEALSALTAGDVTPTVDASDLDPGNYELTPVVSDLPEGVELVGISPGAVPVTITAPEPPPTPAPTPP
jgi:YbbR domain-containing protein